MQQPGIVMSTKGARRAPWTAVLLAVLMLAACTTQPTPTVTPSGRGWRCAFAGTGATLVGLLGDIVPGLLGDIVPGPQGWEIEMGVIAHGDAGFTLESSEMVTVLEIELSDGMHCPFAGVGASLAFEGKRLNFTCPPEGDNEVGLLAEVVITDRGWEMERGFELQSTELVPIGALIVVDRSAP